MTTSRCSISWGSPPRKCWKGFEAAGKDLTREKFLAAYNTIDNFKSSIYPGPITCKGGHKCNESPAFVKLENNNVVFAGSVALK